MSLRARLHWEMGRNKVVIVERFRFFSLYFLWMKKWHLFFKLFKYACEMFIIRKGTGTRKSCRTATLSKTFVSLNDQMKLCLDFVCPRSCFLPLSRVAMGPPVTLEQIMSSSPSLWPDRGSTSLMYLWHPQLPVPFFVCITGPCTG